MKTIIAPADLPRYVPGEIWLDAVDGRWNELSIRGYKYKPSDISATRLAHYLIVLYTGGPTKMSRHVDALANVAGVSLAHFSRPFRNSLGVAPHRYLVQRRLDRARNPLRNNRHSIAEIASVTGFSDQSHLTRHFKRQFGVTPQEGRRK